MFCGNCGKEIKDTNKYCPFCGVALYEYKATLFGKPEETNSELVKSEPNKQDDTTDYYPDLSIEDFKSLKKNI